MKTYIIAFVLLLSLVNSAPCMAQDRTGRSVNKAHSTIPKYVGCWSDASSTPGVLFINRQKIKFGNRGKWVKHTDITQDSEGKFYLLRLFKPGQFNFLKKVVSLTLDGDKMQMTLYESFEDLSNGKKIGWATWYKDKCGTR